MHSNHTPVTIAPTTEKSLPTNPKSSPSLPQIQNPGIDEFDQVIGMKLSDLIREGSQTTRQVTGWGDGNNTACALTAAAKTLNEKGYGLPS